MRDRVAHKRKTCGLCRRRDRISLMAWRHFRVGAIANDPLETGLRDGRQITGIDLRADGVVGGDVLDIHNLPLVCVSDPVQFFTDRRCDKHAGKHRQQKHKATNTAKRNRCQRGTGA